MDSEVYSQPSDTKVAQSNLTHVINMTFLVDMQAVYNETSLGTDYIINATATGCPAGLSVQDPTILQSIKGLNRSTENLSGLNNCGSACSLALFNAANYTASFSQSGDGSFDPGSFTVSSGVTFSDLSKHCSSEAEFNMACKHNQNTLSLLASQVDVRYAWFAGTRVFRFHLPLGCLGQVI